MNAEKILVKALNHIDNIEIRRDGFGKLAFATGPTLEQKLEIGNIVDGQDRHILERMGLNLAETELSKVEEESLDSPDYISKEEFYKQCGGNIPGYDKKPNAKVPKKLVEMFKERIDHFKQHIEAEYGNLLDNPPEPELSGLFLRNSSKEAEKEKLQSEFRQNLTQFYREILDALYDEKQQEFAEALVLEYELVKDRHAEMLVAKLRTHRRNTYQMLGAEDQGDMLYFRRFT